MKRRHDTISTSADYGAVFDGLQRWVVCATDPRSPMSRSADASLVSKASTRYPGCKPDTMKMSSIRFRTRRLVAGSRPPIAVSRSRSMMHLLCVRPTAKSVGKSRPVDLACAEDRPLGVKKSLLSSANANPSVATAQPRPRFRRIGQWWPQGACSPAAAIRAMA
jgi:hypothetical protein